MVGQAGIVIFDRDSTLLDTRPRQARILREFGRVHGVEPLTQVQVAHCNAWNLTRSMANCGLSRQNIEPWTEAVTDFWRVRFFTSEYCVDDAPIPGAVQFVQDIRDAGADIAYCSSRDEAMRSGTITSFRRLGFPEPGSRVSLLMRATRDIPEDEWKKQASEIMRGRGKVVAVFENEPAHANGYRQSFAEALVCTLLPMMPVEGFHSTRAFHRSVTLRTCDGWLEAISRPSR